MKVLHVIPYMHPRAGGPPVVVDRVCSGLAALGCETEIVTTDLLSSGSDDDWASHWATEDRFRIGRVTSGSNYAYSAEVKSLLHECVPRADLVHLHTLWNYPTREAARICRRRDIPYVVMPHGMLDPHSMRRAWWKKAVYGRLIEFPALRRAAGIICTHTEEERLARETCRGLPKAFMTPLGADDPPDERGRLAEEFFAAHPELQGRPIVLFLSRLHEKKGLDLLIPAFARVHAANPRAVLFLVGSGEPTYEGQLRQCADRSGAGDSIVFAGTLREREKWAAMAAADVFVLPSYQENFALVVVDALNIGLPVVLSSRVNICDDVVSAGAGLRCELDAVDIAEQIGSLLTDAGLRESMGQNGRELVQEQFTWARCAEGTLEAYHDVLGTRAVTV